MRIRRRGWTQRRHSKRSPPSSHLSCALWRVYSGWQADTESRSWQSGWTSCSLEVSTAISSTGVQYCSPLHIFVCILTGALLVHVRVRSELRRQLELLSSEHGNWQLLPFHAHVHVIQEQTKSHIKAERHHEAYASLSLLSFFNSYLASDDSPHAEVARPASGNWAVTMLRMPKAGQAKIVKRLLAYLQCLNPAPELWTELIKDLLTCNGSHSGKCSDRQLNFPSVNSKTTTAFATAVCAAINHEMNQCDWLLAQTKVINMYAPPDRGVAAEEEQKESQIDRPALILLARQQFNDQCWQLLLHVAEVVHHIARVSFIKSELEKVGATLIRTLKLITLATKQVYSAARNPSKHFNALMEYTVATLCPTVDGWQQYVTIGMQGVSEKGVRNEARMLPELQKAFSACETGIIRLSRAEFCRLDYTRHMHRFKARDFQLKASVRTRRDTESDEDEEEDSEEESSSEEEEEERASRTKKKQKQRKSAAVKRSQSAKLHASQKKRKRQSSSSESSEESESDKENRPDNSQAFKAQSDGE